MSSKTPKQENLTSDLLLSLCDKNDPNCLHQTKRALWALFLFGGTEWGEPTEDRKTRKGKPLCQAKRQSKKI